MRPDRFNTEASEQLHINFAKHTYAASNRKDYIIQMKTWLARHEAINTFSEYLRWSIPGYDTKADSLDEGLVPNKDNDPSNNELPTPPHHCQSIQRGIVLRCGETTPSKNIN